VRRLSLPGARVALCLAALWGASLAAQTPATPPRNPRTPVLAAIRAEPSAYPTLFAFFNRPIATLRARVMGREPVERADSARRVLDLLIEDGITGPVDSQSFDGGSLIAVAGKGVLLLTTQDIDLLSDETLDAATAQAASRLQQALSAAAEARTPVALLRSTALAAVVVVLALLAIWGVSRARHAAARRIADIAERTVARSGIGSDVVRASNLPVIERALAGALGGGVQLLVIYATVGFVLRQFPYSRPWGDSMRGFLWATAKTLGLGAANAIPGLFTVLVIFAIARFTTKVIEVWFNAIERGQVAFSWIYPETAQPTRRLATALLWVFAVVVAYPYMPGSQTDAFKGVSVFLGLIISLGSSGIVNQIMSGFTITYSRALRPGDFVRIGDVEGTVIHLGVLSTKVKTLRQEDVTIPNAVVVSQTTTDYSRFGDTEGVFMPTSVTIGYDTAWRQVHSLLLLAAERTAGLRHDPKPIVLQAGLEDFYVKYTLFFCLERQQAKPFVLSALHANIQDLFNEYGVQIMSPNYVFDPAAPKIVPKPDWFPAPARPDQPRADE
jgi:small-conductance mechanosensitive channel